MERPAGKVTVALPATPMGTPAPPHVLPTFGVGAITTPLGKVSMSGAVRVATAALALLKVTVSVGGQTSDPLPLLNTFDPDTGLGIPGDYEAPIIPTAPGDYTFHLTGTIHATAVDEMAVSSDSTFNSVVGSTGIEFPNQLPALTDIVTRLDRIDARLANPIPAASTDISALLAGVGVGTVGLLVGLLALTIAIRGRRMAG